MRRSSTVLLTTLCLLALAATPSAAAKRGTWWAAGDGLWVEPSGPDFDTAFDYTSTLSLGGTVLGPDLGRDFSARLRAGWRPKKDGNSYFASYWSFNGSGTLEEDVVVPIVSDPVFTNTFSDRVESGATVKAQILDLTLSRPFAGTKRSSWIWAVGLRHATYDQDWDIDFFEAGLFPGAGPEESVKMRVESAGIGLTTGIGATYEWRKRWRTMARVQWSLLRGQTDASCTDRGFYEDPLSPGTGIFFTDGMDKNNADRVFQQIELEARVIFNVWRSLDVSLGYWFLNWTNASEDLRFLDDVQGGAALSRQDVAFDGLVLGVSYQFN